MCNRVCAKCPSRAQVVFFFQGEDGIRALYVTGVQTCALPIWYWPDVYLSFTSPLYVNGKLIVPQAGLKQSQMRCLDAGTGKLLWEAKFRSEERRVGKEGRAWGRAYCLFKYGGVTTDVQ